jgi:hypothetical protein
MSSPQSITLNLRYDLPQEAWVKIGEVYASMDGWIELEETEMPCWFGREGDNSYVYASVEPSGLQVEGRLDDAVWLPWIAEFQARLTSVLGFEVCDAEL